MLTISGSISSTSRYLFMTSPISKWIQSVFCYFVICCCHKLTYSSFISLMWALLRAKRIRGKLVLLSFKCREPHPCFFKMSALHGALELAWEVQKVLGHLSNWGRQFLVPASGNTELLLHQAPHTGLTRIGFLQVPG